MFHSLDPRACPLVAFTLPSRIPTLARSPLVALSTVLPSSSSTPPIKPASTNSAIASALPRNPPSSTLPVPVSLFSITTMTAGSTFISSTAQPSPLPKVPSPRRAPCSSTTITTARSPTSRTKRASPTNAGASASPSPITTTMAGPTSTSPTTAKIASTITITTARLPTSQRKPALPSAAGPRAQLGATTTTTASSTSSFPATSTTMSTIPSWQGRRSEEHTSELQSLTNLVCRLLLEKNNNVILTIH